MQVRAPPGMVCGGIGRWTPKVCVVEKGRSNPPRAYIFLKEDQKSDQNLLTGNGNEYVQPAFEQNPRFGGLYRLNECFAAQGGCGRGPL